MVVIAAGRHEHRAGAPVGLLEAQHVAVERQRALDIGDLQMHMADPDARDRWGGRAFRTWLLRFVRRETRLYVGWTLCRASWHRFRHSGTREAAGPESRLPVAVMDSGLAASRGRPGMTVRSRIALDHIRPARRPVLHRRHPEAADRRPLCRRPLACDRAVPCAAGWAGRCFWKARPASARPRSPRCWPRRSAAS